ncbi:DoxX family protein [Glycomyces mayteni]|uniref:DoxX family protein n=1 Tax=Glycomyces mayteni TaxID=543887 RepID=A0ABW2DHL1_9ACTN|nr:DoxX family protein [Glycomyces mayteni]
MSTNDIATAKTTDAERPAKGLHVTLWVLQVLLGVFMIAASGAPKLFGVESAAEGFDTIGWGDWFMYAIGALEVAGGVGLLIPRVSGLAATGLGLLMIGAAIFNATILDFPVYTPLILLVLFAFIAWGRRYQTRRFLTRGFKAL